MRKERIFNKQIMRSRRFIAQLIMIVAAVCLCLTVTAITGDRHREGVKSFYYEDESMPANSTSVLDRVRLVVVNCERDGFSFSNPDEIADPHVYFNFRDKQKRNVRSLCLKLEQALPYKLDAMLYYPDSEGEYSDDNTIVVTLPSGGDTFYYELPEDVDYPIAGFRFDIEGSYTIGDILISDQPLEGGYDFSAHYGFRAKLAYFFALLIVFELIYFLAPHVRQLLTEWFGRPGIKTVIVRGVVIPCGAAFCVFGIYYLFRRTVKWDWFFIFLIYAELLSWERLLLKRSGSGRKFAHFDRKGTLIAYWTFVLALELLILYAWGERYAVEDVRPIAQMGHFFMPFVFMGLQTFVLALLFRRRFIGVAENEISFINTYCFVIFLTGLAFLFLFLPFVSPDENNHYASAYRVANVLLGKTGEIGNSRVLMRMEDYQLLSDYRTSISARELLRYSDAFRPLAQDTGLVAVYEPMTTNAIFSYVPTGIGIALGRILHLSAIAVFYLGRLFNLLFYVVAIRYVMKIIPFGRTAVFVISMLPMMLHVMGSYSYDSATFCFAALFTAQVMRMISAQERVSKKDLIRCACFSVLLGPSKLVFIPLLLMIFLIPVQNLGETRAEGRKKQFLLVGAGVASAVVIMMAANLISSDSAIRTMTVDHATVHYLDHNQEEGYTVTWVLSHMGSVIMLFIRTLITRVDYYFLTMFGYNLGWLNIYLPHQMVVVMFLIFYLMAANIRDDASAAVRIGGKRKAWIALLCFCSVLLTMLAMLLDWTPLSSKLIEGVQGRYFLPLLVPGIWIVRGRLVRVDTDMRKFLLAGSAALNIWSIVYIFAHYSVTALPAG